MAKKDRDAIIFTDEIHLRGFDIIAKTRKERIRQLCTALGLIQPADSRDVAVHLLEFFLSSKDRVYTSVEIAKAICGEAQASESNCRRQLKNFLDARIIARHSGKYYFMPHLLDFPAFIEANLQNKFGMIMFQLRALLKEIDKENG